MNAKAQIEKACRELEQEKAESAKHYRELLAQAGKGELVEYYDNKIKEVN